MATLNHTRPQRRPALSGRLPSFRAKPPLRWVAALGVLACALAGGLLAHGGNERAPQSDKFLTQALGEQRPGAPLVRRPTPGVRVRLDRSGFRVSGREGTTSLELIGGGTGRWARYESGVARPTAFGRETILVTPEKTEQFLTVARRQGTKTRRWRLRSNVTPRVGADGAVGFLSGGRLLSMHVEPVAVLDAGGHDVTPEGLRWSLARDRGGWLLELRLDDRRLPLPYVIDPAITYRSALTSNNGAAGAASINLNLPGAVADSDLLFAHISARGGSNMSIATPTGWTLLRDANNGTTTRLTTFYRVASSEPAFYTFTFGGGTPSQQAVGAITAYYGLKTSDPLDLNGPTSTNTNATPTANAVTTVAANTLVIAAFSHGAGFNLTTSPMFTTVTGMTERYDAQSTNATAANRAGLAADTMSRTTAGTTSNRSTTASVSAAWVAHQVAFKADDVFPTAAQDDPGANLRGTITISGTASDADSGVQQVQFQGCASPCGGGWSNLGAPDTTSPYSILYDTTAAGDGLYDLRAVATDFAANVTNSAPVTGRLVDNTAPSSDVSVIEGTRPDLQYFDTATDTHYYNPSAAGDFTFQNAAADTGGSGVASVSFPAIALTGFTGSPATDPAAPYDSSTYSFDPSNVAAPTGYSVQVADVAGNPTNDGVTFVRDTTAPTGHSISLVGGPYYTSESVPLTIANGTDAGAGLDSSSGIVERDVAPFSGTCGSFSGSWTQVVLVGGADTSVQVGNCYRYRYSVADNVGNRAAFSTPSADAIVAPGISLRGAVGGNNGGTGTTSLVLNKPSGVAANDFLVAQVTVRGGTGVTITAPGGWTFIRREDATTNLSQAVYYRVAGASEPASYTWSFSNVQRAAGGIVSYMGVDNSAPIHTSSGVANTTGTSSAVQAPAVTTTVANAMIVGFFGIRSASTFTPPAGMTERWDTNAGASPTSEAADALQTAIGSSGAKTANATTAAVWVGQLVALRPDTAPPSAPVQSISESNLESHASGSTFFYRPGGAGGTFDVTASTGDNQSGVQKVVFPGLGGGFTPTGSLDVLYPGPYTRTYTWPGASGTESGVKTVTVRDNAKNSSAGTFQVTPDSTAPTSSAACAPPVGCSGWATTSPVTLTLSTDDGAGSGIRYVKYTTDGSDPTAVNGTVYTVPLSLFSTTTVKFRAWDNVDNLETVRTQVVQIDTSAPLPPTLSFGSLTNAVVNGGVLWYLPSAVSGQFAVTASATDADSGIASYGFPAAATGWSRSIAGAIATYSHTGAPSDPTDPNQVTAQNNAGLTSLPTGFTVNPDATAPVTSILCNGAACSGSWYGTGVSISLSASEAGSGLYEIRYTTDGSDPTPLNGNVYSAPFLIASTETVRFRSYDRLGNEEAVGSQLIQVDTTAPLTSAGAANTTGSTYWNGSGTVFYRPSGSGSFDLTATVTDPQSGPQKANFPAMAGFGAGGDDTTVPYSASYSYTGTPAEPGAKDVTGYDNAGLTSTATINVTADSAGPTGHSATIAGGYYTALSVAVTLGNGSDAGAGIDAASGIVERGEAPLDNGDGSCDAFPGSWSTVTLSGGNDTSVQAGRCYRYRYQLSDRVGNQSTSGASATAKIETTAPVAPSLAYGSFSNAALAGGVVWYRPSAGAGQFAVTASASDAQSGIASFGFPAAASGWSRSVAGATATYSHSGSPADPAEPNDVSAQNNAGLNSAATSFTVSPDSAAPTGQSATVTGGYYTALSVPVTLGNGSDGESGLDAASGVVERDSIALSAGSCGTFPGSWSSVTLTAGADTTVLNGNCYRYRYTISDRVGNASAPSAPSASAKIDTGQPSVTQNDPGTNLRTTVPVTASASDALSDIASVTIQRSPAGAGTWTPIGTDTTAPFSVDFDTTAVTDGLYDFRAIATDGAGNSAISSVVVNRRVDNTLPTAIMDNPGGSLNDIEVLTGQSTDIGGSGTSTVMFQYTPAGTGTWTTIGTDTSSPYSVNWDTWTVSDGRYDLRVIAIDFAGNSKTSNTVNNRQVQNLPPFGSITAPVGFVNAADPSPYTITAIASAIFPKTVTQVEFFRCNDASANCATGTYVSLSVDTTAPYSAQWAQASEPEGDRALRAIVTDSSFSTGGDNLNVTIDRTAPASQTIALNGGPWYATASVPFTTGDGNDGGSGLDPVSRLVQRASAPVADAVCDPLGAFAGSFVSPDASVSSGSCYRYRFSIADNAGNRSAWVETGDAMIDTSEPSTPALAIAESPADPDQHVAGTTLYYRPGGGRSGSFSVDATTSDAQSGIAKVIFPVIPGVSGGGDDLAGPFQAIYGWTETTSNTDSHDVVAQNGAGLPSSDASFALSPDSAAPTGQTAALVGGPYFTTTSLSFTTGNGVDSDADLDLSSIIVQRAEAPLVAGTCDPLGAFAGSYSSPDTSVTSGSCYRYRLSIADNVGNRSAWVETGTAKIDTSAPSAPGLSLGSFTSASATGSTVFYRPSAGSGEFTVTASSADGQSGVASYSFPAPAAGWSIAGSGASRTYSHSGSPADPAEPNDVTAQNNAGLTSTASSFDVTPDGAGPTGHSATIAGGYYTTLSVAVTLDNGSDAGAGVDAASGIVERDEETLSADSCPAFDGSWSTVALSGGADTSVQSGKCYRYRYQLSDRVGNQSTSGASATAKIDSSAPGAPSLAYGSFSNATLNGGVVWYRPSAADGQFAVTASAADAQSGIASYAFPAAASGWSRSVAGATATYSHSGSPSDPAEPNNVTARNNAGLDSAPTSFTVSADGVAPTTSIACDGAACTGWSTAPVSVTLSANDADSGLAQIRYTIDGSDPTATTGTLYSGAFLVSATTEIRYRAFDLVGNTETVGSQQIEFDATGPTGPSLTLTEAPADPDQHVLGSTLYYRPGGGRAGSFTVDAVTSDPQSGIQKVSFPAVAGMTGGGDDLGSPYTTAYDWTAATAASGSQTVTARNNGGLTNSASFTVTPDAAGPTGHSIALSGGPYYTALSVPLTLGTGSDSGSGVNAASGVVERQSATLSNGNCVSWSGIWAAVTLTGGADTSVLTDSCYRYRYSISDNVGNDSGVSTPSADARVDATAPMTGDDAAAGWNDTAVTVSLSVTETGSGVASTQYRIDGGSFQNGTSVAVPAPADHSNDGAHTIEYRSTDAAGNVELLRSATVRIDTTLPTTTDNAPGGWRNSAVTVTLAPSDALSGVVSTQYRIDGGSFQSGTSVAIPAPADHSNDGVHTIEYRSIDAADNVEPLRSATVRIDTTLPTGSVITPIEGLRVNGVVPVTAAAADLPSGVTSVEFFVRPSGAPGFTSISTDTTAPYEASWDSLSAAEGDAALKVVVLDGAANSVTSALRNVIVDNPPNVSLDDPGANVRGLINLSASSPADTAQVVFERSLVGAGTWAPIATDLTAPFAASFDTTGVADEHYDFRAVATDVGGFGGTSPLRTARVDNTMPSVSVSDPANNSTVGGANVHLGALASDLGSGVASVQFEGRPAGSGSFDPIGSDTVAPYDASWNASALSGIHELRATALDSAGNPGTSVAILVFVDSTAPSVTLGDLGSMVRGVVTLSAATQGAAVTRVVFKRKPSGGNSWTALETDTAGPWNAAFDTKAVSDGLYDLRAQALDSVGAVLASHTRENVRVDNTAPVLQSASPADGSSVSSVTSIVLVADETVAAVRGATLDGAVATAEIAGAHVTFATGTLSTGDHTLIGSLEDAAGNASSFRVKFSVRVAAPTTFVMQIGKPSSSKRKRNQIFSLAVTLSTPARVQVTLLSPRGRRLRTTSSKHPAGRRVVSLSIPRASLPPGRYTMVVTATTPDGTQVLRRAQIMIKKAKPPAKKKRKRQTIAPREVAATPVGVPKPPPPATPSGTTSDGSAPSPRKTAEKPSARSMPLATTTKFVGEQKRRTLGLVLVIMSIGGAIGFLIKIELHRLLGWPRRFAS